MVGISGYRLACWFCAALIGLAGSNIVAAEGWPTAQPIKVIAPTTPGSTADLMARIVFEQVGRQLGQTVVVENRGGAGTIVGMNAVAKAPPDGYTVLVNSTSYVVVASTYAHLPYDPYHDMTGIALLARFPVVVLSSLKYKRLAQLIAAGRAKSSPLTFGTLGIGSSGQLATARLMLAAGFDGTNVPYRGTAEAMNELVAGRLDMYSGVVPNALQLAKAGKINILALESANRSVLFPGVPTTREAGYPNSDYNFWMGSYAPAKTPPEIVQRLNAEARKALQMPEIKSRILTLGGEVDPGEGMTVAQFDDFIIKERAANAAIVKLIHYQPQ
jgi:tripartite-type tricarboxylate transporter receptor subunit TctC